MRLRMTGTVLGGLILALVPFLSTTAAPASAAAPTVHHACATAAPGRASCAALVVDAGHRLAPDAAPSGLAPADIQSAYKLPSSTAGTGQTIAVVDAFDDPNAEADLAKYRSQFGLSACTAASGCFAKVDQNGGTSYPAPDVGWAEEISLDLDMVSATCPRCKILLVEADSSSFADLGAAENTAARLANVISNSYGGSDASDATYGAYFNHPGRAITASAGDSGFGFGVDYPASSHYVTAVGGTSLRRAAQTVRGWTETGIGSGGCSSFNVELSGQVGVIPSTCTRRAVVDVAAVGDPATGVAVYDTYGGVGGWLVFGGTSVAAPIIAGVYGLAGNAASINNNYPYAHASSLFDITSGGSGGCTPPVWCIAGPGWDGPTGVGTPNGVGGF
jgi:subtilase family serine protease